MIMKEMEKKVTSYEKYLGKIIKNYDQAGQVFEIVSEEHDKLVTENQELRKMAAAQDIDVEALLGKGDCNHHSH